MKTSYFPLETLKALPVKALLSLFAFLDKGTLLGLMHSTPVTDIKLKSDVLASLIRIFDINAQTRSVFQEVGGFVYVVSILVSLEGSLDDPPVALWAECKLCYFCIFCLLDGLYTHH